ncbi:MAG: hypothetical protein IGS03_10270 [Candidatus Sericytochromatia bacterium]|nr:hypothetical protein [Candidatus Sericytochromatia bacterium]
MAESEQPPRSLRRDGGGPRYYRDWSAADEVLDHDYDPPPAPPAPAEMQMVEGFEDEAPVSPPPAPAVPREMAPLKVIVPQNAPEPEAKAPPKPTITRIDRSKIQRARRYDELKAEEEARKAEEEAAQREELARQAPPDRSAKTRGLTPATPRTTELQSNIKELGGKLDETKENIKSTADALSQNLRQFSEQLTTQIVGGIQKLGQSLNGLIGRWGNRPVATSSRRADDDADFEDEPLENPAQAEDNEALLNAAAGPAARKPVAQKPAPRQADPLEDVPYVPPVMYADLLKEKVYFLTFDKQPLVEAPESMDTDALQAVFLENARQDIRKCIKLVAELPDPKEGPYKGIPFQHIFKHVREQDLYFFMHYVLSKPDPFRKKTFKISEAFATWVLKRSHTTVVSEPFPDIPAMAYYPLYKDNIRFQTVERKQLVLATGKQPDEVEALFMERALEDIIKCVKMVERFPAAAQGPYKGKPLKQIFRYVKPRDIHFFLHYVAAQPEVFRGQNFKLAEAFASWILKRSHETRLPE